jgi:malonyl CoA-acyl carrier protein transacylase/phosphopantetheinyl transferase
MTNLHRTWDSEVYIISAPSRADLLAAGRKLESFLQTNPGVDGTDLAFTLNCLDSGLRDARLAIVAASPADLRRKLTSAMDRLAQPETSRIKERSGVYYFDSKLAREGRLSFVFPGEGAQYLNMLADLCLHFPEVRGWFDLIDRASSEQRRDYRPSDVVFPPKGTTGDQEAEQRLWSMDCGSELVFAASQALLGLLSDLGVRPDAVVGHSSGEYSSLIAAGCIHATDPERLVTQMIDLNAVYRRLRDAGQIPAGSLVAVGAISEAAVRDTAEQSPGTVFVAMDNCPQQLVLCCVETDPAPTVSALKNQGAVCVTLPFNRAYHTPLFESFCNAFDDFLDGLEIKPPTLDMYSCVTADVFPPDPDAIRALVRGQWSSPVRFRETTETMYAAGVRTFVEIGPRGNLASFIDNTLMGRPHLAIPINVPQRSGILQLNHAIGLLAAHGFDVQPDGLYKHRSPRRLDLDTVVAKGDSRRFRIETSMPVLGSDALRSLALSPSSTTRSHGATASEERAQADGDQQQAEAAATRSTAPAAPAHSAHSAGKSEVMQRYLETMEKFVAVQADVMCAYLTGSPSGPGRLIQASSQAAGIPGVTPFPAPASPSLLPVSIPTEPTHVAPNPAGVKGAEEPGEVEPASANGLPHPAMLSASDITTLLQRLVSARTGYPIEMIEPELNLEADLGIDSIKRVEILGALHVETDLVHDGDVEKAAGLKTLAELADFLAGNQTNVAGGLHPIGTALREPPQTTSAPAGEPAPQGVDLPGRGIVLTRRIDLSEHLYLRDHTLGGAVSAIDTELTALPLVPLAMSLEFMAEAAAELVPDLTVISIENVSARRWIAVDSGPVELRIAACRQAADPVSRIDVKVYDTGATENQTDDPVVEGVIVLAGNYPSAPDSRAPTVAARPAEKGPTLYSGAMFHGGTFQAVSAITQDAADSMEAMLDVPARTRFFASEPTPCFLSDPVLVDAAGQVVGFWAMRHLPRGFNVFPYRVEALRFYGPPLPVGGAAVCRAYIHTVSESRLSSDLDILRTDGSLYLRAEGWQDARVDVPETLQRMRIQPRTSVLSDPVGIPGEPAGAAVRLVADLPAEALQALGGICQLMLADLVLSRTERAEWQALDGSPKRRHEWLLGRAAVKDAVRLLIAGGRPPDKYPADIEVSHDQSGRPFARGAWHSASAVAPHVSISHSGGIAIAAAANDRQWDGVGIDLELLSHRQGDLDFAFTAGERELLDAIGTSERGEWSLRLWCAKEATAKALGTGLIARPGNLEAVACDTPSGDLWVSVAAIPASRQKHPRSERVLARTQRRGDMIIAVALIERMPS